MPPPIMSLADLRAERAALERRVEERQRGSGRTIRRWPTTCARWVGSRTSCAT